MQIICNHCGNDLSFPNHQHLVTCSHCYTHLQVEEHDNRIFATIVEDNKLDDSIFESKNIIANSFPNALYDLLHLEGEYEETLEDTAFYSLTQRLKNRPSLFRAFFRLLISSILIVLFFIAIGDIINNPPNSITAIFTFIALLLYWFTITKGAIKEFLKGRELRQFEKYYLNERTNLLAILEQENLSNSIHQTINNLSDNYDEHLDIIDAFFYIELFSKFRIKVGAPSISKGLRIFGIGIPTGLIALGFGLSGYGFAFLFAALAIISVFLGFFVLGDSDEYKRSSQLNSTKRTATLDKLRKLMR